MKSSHIPLPARLPAALAAALAALAILALQGISPTPAAAGEFTIASCQANGSFSSGAFQDFATRGMKWRRACNPLGPGLRGLVTANVSGEGHVAVGAQSAFVLEAPPGTTFTKLRWSGAAHRRDCRYALQFYAVDPDGTSNAIRDVRAGRDCPREPEAQASSWPRPTTYQLGGATKLVQRVVCMGTAKTDYCSAKGQNYLETLTSEATVVDETPPSVSVTPGGPLVAGEWVSGTQTVGYEASDNTGVKEVRGYVGGDLAGESSRACDYTQRIPCPDGPGQLSSVETQHLPEGTQQLHLTATDAAGNRAESAPVTVRIDNTAPGAVPAAVEGGEAWRNHDAFALDWANPPEVERAPIVAADWRICRVGTQECQTGTADGPSIATVGGLSVPGPGEWEAQVWRQDAAGNTQPQNASVPVRLRFDPEPPELGFEPISAQDPTRVAVHVADKVSGVAAGEVELSRVGSGVWQPLATQLEGEELVTHIEDASLPAGEYQLRATATDRAGNEASSESRVDGQPMKVTLPLRVQTTLSSGVERDRVGKKVVHRDGHRRVVRHKTSELVPKTTVAFGRKTEFSGRLLDKSGNPIAGAPVTVYQQVAEEAEAQVGTLTTGAEGGFAYEVPADSSRKLRFVYAGTATSLPAEGSTEVLVHGTSTLKVKPDHVLNGDSVTFTGEVEGRPLPQMGKLVELQVRESHEWTTFRTIRSNTRGEWSIEYPFERTCGVEEYPFRIELPGEAGFPLEPGHSHTVTVTVRGRPCPTG